jgi:hypothetical protein
MGVRPEVEALIITAKARGAEEALRGVAEAIRNIAESRPTARLREVGPLMVDAFLFEADENARRADEHAAEAGWALS